MLIEQTSPGAAGQAWTEEQMRERVDRARIGLDADPDSRRARSVLGVAAGTKSATSIAQPTCSERAKVKKIVAHGANVAEAVIAVG